VPGQGGESWLRITNSGECGHEPAEKVAHTIGVLHLDLRDGNEISAGISMMSRDVKSRYVVMDGMESESKRCNVDQEMKSERKNASMERRMTSAQARKA
jgi:hypothetical protein